jgi:hypothetical protein
MGLLRKNDEWNKESNKNTTKKKQEKTRKEN